MIRKLQSCSESKVKKLLLKGIYIKKTCASKLVPWDSDDDEIIQSLIRKPIGDIYELIENHVFRMNSMLRFKEKFYQNDKTEEDRYCTVEFISRNLRHSNRMLIRTLRAVSKHLEECEIKGEIK